MHVLITLLPVLLFIVLYVGGGVYFTCMGVANAFYQLSPLTAILPAIVLSWVMHKGSTKEKTNDFLDGIGQHDIISMCVIFLLAGAFSEITKGIGSVNSTIYLANALIPSKFLLVGIFIITAFISTAIGTSMATIATVAPIAVGLSEQASFSTVLAAATVVGGAMFGDNISLISDTTIAAVNSQEADLKKKMKINLKIAAVACILTMIVLFFYANDEVDIPVKPYKLVLVMPYVILVVLACSRLNVFASLLGSIVCAAVIGYIDNPANNLLFINQKINSGFISVNEIMLLSLMIGGLSGLSGKDFAKDMASYLSAWITKRKAGARAAQLMIAKIVSIFDVMLANNTIAIILSGKIAKSIAQQHNVPPHYSAAWLDIFSCVFQGIIPYGAQVLLVSAIASVSPLEVVLQVYYCYILGLFSLLYIVYRCKEENLTK